MCTDQTVPDLLLPPLVGAMGLKKMTLASSLDSRHHACRGGYKSKLAPDIYAIVIDPFTLIETLSFASR